MNNSALLSLLQQRYEEKLKKSPTSISVLSVSADRSKIKAKIEKSKTSKGRTVRENKKLNSLVKSKPKWVDITHRDTTPPKVRKDFPKYKKENLDVIFGNDLSTPKVQSPKPQSLIMRTSNDLPSRFPMSLTVGDSNNNRTRNLVNLAKDSLLLDCHVENNQVNNEIKAQSTSLVQVQCHRCSMPLPCQCQRLSVESSTSPLRYTDTNTGTSSDRSSEQLHSPGVLQSDARVNYENTSSTIIPSKRQEDNYDYVSSPVILVNRSTSPIDERIVNQIIGESDSISAPSTHDRGNYDEKLDKDDLVKTQMEFMRSMSMMMENMGSLVGTSTGGKARRGSIGSLLSPNASLLLSQKRPPPGTSTHPPNSLLLLPSTHSPLLTPSTSLYSLLPLTHLYSPLVLPSTHSPSRYFALVRVVSLIFSLT